jgi:hypothetical protein
MFQGDREADRYGPDGLVFRPRQADRIRAATIGALAEVDVHGTFEAEARVVRLLRPLVHLAEDGFVGGFLLPPVSHGGCERRASLLSGCPPGPALPALADLWHDIGVYR